MIRCTARLTDGINNGDYASVRYSRQYFSNG